MSNRNYNNSCFFFKGRCFRFSFRPSFSYSIRSICNLRICIRRRFCKRRSIHIFRRSSIFLLSDRSPPSDSMHLLSLPMPLVNADNNCRKRRNRFYLRRLLRKVKRHCCRNRTEAQDRTLKPMLGQTKQTNS